MLKWIGEEIKPSPIGSAFASFQEEKQFTLLCPALRPFQRAG